MVLRLPNNVEARQFPSPAGQIISNIDFQGLHAQELLSSLETAINPAIPVEKTAAFPLISFLAAVHLDQQRKDGLPHLEEKALSAEDQYWLDQSMRAFFRAHFWQRPEDVLNQLAAKKGRQWDITKEAWRDYLRLVGSMFPELNEVKARMHPRNQCDT